MLYNRLRWAKRLTGKVVALVRHTKLTSQEYRNQQQHVLVAQLLPDSSSLNAGCRLLHVRDLCTVTADHLLRLRQQQCERRTERRDSDKTKVGGVGDLALLGSLDVQCQRDGTSDQRTHLANAHPDANVSAISQS